MKTMKSPSPLIDGEPLSVIMKQAMQQGGVVAVGATLEEAYDKAIDKKKFRQFLKNPPEDWTEE